MVLLKVRHPPYVIRDTKYVIPNFPMIAHIDADAFFASALQRKNPRLKGKPLLATGMGGGCVIAASYEAKAYGVKTGMRLMEAKKLVPHAVVMPADYHEACIASEQLQNILKNDCFLVQRYSVDEWFLDLNTRPGGCPSHVQSWAQELQAYIQRSTSLTVSFGVAPSKLLAKMASEYRKPVGITVLYKDDIARFLQDRTAKAIPGIGRRRSLHAQSNHWLTAWDIAQANPETIKKLFGKPGRDIQRELLGECVEPIFAHAAPPKSISRCRSFRATRDEETIYAQLHAHLSRTVLKMRSQNLAAQRVTVWLRNDTYDRMIGDDHKLPQILATEEELLPYIRKCFLRAYEKGNAYTQVGLGLMDLRPQTLPQYSLFQSPLQLESCEKVQKALDSVHQRYGRDAVIRGSGMQMYRRNKDVQHPTMYGEVLAVH
jgi:DNA polymerase IV